MKRLFQFASNLYSNTTSSIAFYPTLISLLFLVASFVMLIVEDQEVTKFILENFPQLVINNSDTARAILTTLIGGILSLTVFSFSMVMILLNQASSNFSPRLLPGLISDRRNQIVLGIYLGTIIYNIFILISIDSSDTSNTSNGFSVLIGIVLGVFCLGMFVFFIHSISTSIQISNILRSIYDQAARRLTYLREHQDSSRSILIEVKDNWTTICAKKGSYFVGVDIDGLLEFAEKHNTSVLICQSKGTYVLPGHEIIKHNKELSKKDLQILESYILMSTTLSDQDNFVLGMQQITEVGVKAMSPGINDPGTAVMTIDYLSHLFALRMRLLDKRFYYVNQQTTIELKVVSFQELLYRTLAAYRLYCKHDVILMKKLVEMMLYLSKSEACEQSYIDEIQTQLDVIVREIRQNIGNKEDSKYLFQDVDQNSM